MNRLVTPLTLVLVAMTSTVGCRLVDAAFGRVCEVDDDCRGDPADGDLTCRSGRCLTPEVIEVVSTGETCADAIPIELDRPVQGSTATAANDHGAICAGGDAPDRVYVLNLQARANVVVTLDVDGFDGALYASGSADCRTESLLPSSCTDSPVENIADEVMRLDGVGPGEVYIIVDGARPALAAVSGTYTLSVSLDVTCESGFAEVNGRCVGVVGEVNATVARTNAAAVLLDDGRVLLTGGRAGPDLLPTTSAEVYDPETNAFTAVASMATSRARHVIAKLATGEAIVMGGVTDDAGEQVPTASVELFDPATDTWSDGPDLPRARDLLTATVLRSGEVLIAGGRDGAATLTDTAFLNATHTAWRRGPVMAVPRFGHAAVFLEDSNLDDVYLIGGRVGPDSQAVAEAEIVEGESVTVLPDLARERGGAVAVALAGGNILVAGGFSGSLAGEVTATFIGEVFSVGARTWADTVSPMSTPRLFATGTLMPGLGVVLAGGGLDAPSAAVEVYDEDTSGFLPLPSLRHPRLAHNAVLLRDGRLLLMGGDGGNETDTVPLAAAELYGVAP